MSADANYLRGMSLDPRLEPEVRSRLESIADAMDMHEEEEEELLDEAIYLTESDIPCCLWHVYYRAWLRDMSDSARSAYEARLSVGFEDDEAEFGVPVKPDEEGGDG